MTENIPPGSASKGAVKPPEPTARGLPYYEKLRRDLRDTLQKKRILDKNMATLEETIYRQETLYLEETSTAGNIIKGFDNYIKSSTIPSANAGAGGSSSALGGPSTGGGGGGSGTISGSAAGGGGGGPGTARRKQIISDGDRVFSRSSTSYMRDSDSSGSAAGTPSHGGGTPTGGFGTAGLSRAGSGAGGGVKDVKSAVGGGAEKKKKKSVGGVTAVAAAEESEMEGKPNKRARISYGPRE